MFNPTIRLKLVAFLALVLGLAAAPARADVYTFSYAFGDNTFMVSGLLDGTRNGDYLNNVSLLSLTFTFNDTVSGSTATLTAPLYAVKFDGGFSSGPIVSFTGALNQFGFSDADLVKDPSSFTGVFFMNGGAYAQAWYGPVGGATDMDVSTIKWSLASIPDTGTTLGLLGVGLGVLAWMRRRYPITAVRISAE